MERITPARFHRAPANHAAPGTTARETNNSMGFLDNLEHSLKNLESRDERDSQDERNRREAEGQAARAAAPFAEQLRTAPFTEQLMAQATRLGFAQRTKVHIAWLGATLRLEARERRLELRPTPEGVMAVFLKDGVEARQHKLDLSGDAEKLAREWLTDTAGW